MGTFRLENIKVVDSVKNWEESIEISGQLLVDGGFIEPRYIDAIFNSTEKNGPYYVLAPNIAMPHASPEDGVIESQISLLIVKEAFKFSEEGYDVRLVFTLGSTDSESHLGFLRTLSDLFSDDAMLEKLIAANSSQEAYDLLQIIQKGGIE